MIYALLTNISLLVVYDELNFRSIKIIELCFLVSLHSSKLSSLILLLFYACAKIAVENFLATLRVVVVFIHNTIYSKEVIHIWGSFGRKNIPFLGLSYFELKVKSVKKSDIGGRLAMQ